MDSGSLEEASVAPCDIELERISPLLDYISVQGLHPIDASNI